MGRLLQTVIAYVYIGKIESSSKPFRFAEYVNAGDKPSLPFQQIELLHIRGFPIAIDG
jgi:hypothetical protein